MTDEDELAKHANVVLLEVVVAMQKEGLLDEAQARGFLETHCVVVAKKGIFNRILDSVLGIKEGHFLYYVVRVIK